MATGYTHNTYEGRPETIAEFVTHLARGLGAYVMQRDESMDEPLKPREVSSIYKTMLTQAQQRLDAILSMTDEEKREKMQAVNEENAAAYEETLDNHALVTQRYYNRLHDFESLDWSLEDVEGPVGEFFRGLHKFGKDQLESSIKFDCYEPSAPITYTDVDKWYAKEVEFASTALTRAAKSYAEEVKRVADQNLIHKTLTKWIEDMSKTS